MDNRTFNRDIILILAASFFYMACPMLVTPLITGFSESLGASGAVMGIIGGLMNISSLICRPIAGNLADRMSKYRLSLIGAVFMTLSCLGYITASGNIMLVLSRILHGIGFSCCSVCLSTWMADMLPRDKVGYGMGLYGTMNALSMAITPFLGIQLYSALGYRYAFILAMVFSILTGIIIRFIKDSGVPDAKEPPVDSGLHLIDRKVIPVAVIIMLFTIPYCATQSFLVSYVKARQLNVSVSIFFPLYAVVLFVLRMTLKKYFDKVRFSVFMTISAFCALISMTVLTYMKHDLYLFFAAVFMAGGYGIMCSVAQSKAILLAGKGHEGLANGTYYVGLDLGMALGPIIGGLLYGSLDIAYFYPVLMTTVPLCFAVNFFFRTDRRQG